MEHLRRLSKPQLIQPHRSRLSFGLNVDPTSQFSELSKTGILSKKDRMKTILGAFGIEVPEQENNSRLYLIVGKVLWTAVIIAFAALTAKMCTELFLRYINAPTTSQLNVMYNKTFQLPTSTVCLPNYAFEFDNFASDKNIAATHYQDAVETYFNKSKPTKSEFLDGFDSWPNSVLTIVNTYTGEMVKAESLSSFDTLRTNYEFGHPPAYYMKNGGDDQWLADFILEKHINALNISFAELRRALGQALKEKFRLKIGFHKLVNGELENEQIEDIEATYIDWWWTCYTVDFSRLNVVLSSAREYVQISINASEQPNKAKVYRDPMIAVDLKNQFAIDMQWGGDDTSDNLIRAYLDSATTYTIRATAAYHTMAVKQGKMQCYVNSTLELCRWQCRRNLIQKVCGCAAATLPAMNELSASEDTACTMDKYRKCNLRYDINDDGECIETCLQPCDRWDYEIQRYDDFNSEVRWGYNDDDAKFGALRLMAKNFDYLSFQEQYLYSTEDFMGAFGGALGLWLGIDFVILIQLILFLLSVMYKFVKYVKSRKNSVQQTENNERSKSVPKVVVIPSDNNGNDRVRRSTTIKVIEIA